MGTIVSFSYFNKGKIKISWTDFVFVLYRRNSKWFVINLSFLVCVIWESVRKYWYVCCLLIRNIDLSCYYTPIKRRKKNLGDLINLFTYCEERKWYRKLWILYTLLLCIKIQLKLVTWNNAYINYKNEIQNKNTWKTESSSLNFEDKFLKICWNL